MVQGCLDYATNNSQSSSVLFMDDVNTLFTNISVEGIYIRKLIQTNQTVPNLKNQQALKVFSLTKK